MLTLLFAAAALLAPAPDPLAPMAWMAGHCWRAEATDSGIENWQCVERAPDGAIHARHEGRNGDERNIFAESWYRWDPEAGVIRYLVDRPGTINDVEGIVTPNGDTLDMGEITTSGRNVQWLVVHTGEETFEALLDFHDGKGPVISTRFHRMD